MKTEPTQVHRFEVGEDYEYLYRNGTSQEINWTYGPCEVVGRGKAWVRVKLGFYYFRGTISIIDGSEFAFLESEDPQPPSHIYQPDYLGKHMICARDREFPPMSAFTRKVK